MKIRTDFVANSSSSSFVLARKGALNEKQKAAVIAYIEENLLGRRVESMEQLQQFAEENGFCEDSELFQESRVCSVKNMSVYWKTSGGFWRKTGKGIS